MIREEQMDIWFILRGKRGNSKKNTCRQGEKLEGR